jgi:hypothetical protein
MIYDDEELAIVRKHLALIEHGLDELRRDVLPKNKRNFEILSEGDVDQIAQMKAEINAYLAARRKKGAAKKKPAANGKRRRVPKPQRT